MSSFLDRLRGRAKQAVDEHGDKITKGLDRAAAEADKRTKGKYSDQIAKGRSKAQDAMDKLDDGPGDGPGGVRGDEGGPGPQGGPGDRRP